MYSTGHFTVVIILLIPTTVCNGFLLYFMSTKPGFNTTPNKFYSSMLKSNIIACLFVCTTVFVIMFSEEVASNNLFCFGMGVIDRSLLAVATFSLAALSAERHRYVVKQYSSTKAETKRSLAIVWITSFGFGFGCVIVEFVVEQASVGFGELAEGVCIIEYYDRLTSVVTHVIDFFALFLVPTAFMSSIYYRTIKKLWFMPYSDTFQNQEEKKKTVIMTVTVTILHMLTWAPISGFKILFITLHSNNPRMAHQTLQLFGQFSGLILTCVRFLVLPMAYMCSCNHSIINTPTVLSNRIQPNRPQEQEDTQIYVISRRGSLNKGENTERKQEDSRASMNGML